MCLGENYTAHELRITKSKALKISKIHKTKQKMAQGTGIYIRVLNVT